jgi:hypothetical protein
VAWERALVYDDRVAEIVGRSGGEAIAHGAIPERRARR